MPSYKLFRYRFIIFLPIILLTLTAGTQIVLSLNKGLSPWSGGGFGMFSTTDAGGSRHLHAFAETPGVRRELLQTPDLEMDIEKFLAFPTESGFKEIAGKLSENGIPDEGPSKINIQVWKKTFDSNTLEPTTVILKSYTTSGAENK